jgi:hypothetical protein
MARRRVNRGVTLDAQYKARRVLPTISQIVPTGAQWAFRDAVIR